MMPLILLLAAGAVQAAPEPAPAKEKRICRTMEADTGSHFPGKRVCRTKSEWASVDAANQGNARALSDQATRGNATIN